MNYINILLSLNNHEILPSSMTRYGVIGSDPIREKSLVPLSL
jgi:hypothetical protein